jgi:hypothetical protein
MAMITGDCLRALVLGAFLATMTPGSDAWAQALSAPSFTTPEAAAYWKTSAAGDVEAAYRLLRDNHPGAAPEADDPAFRRELETAHATAATRASKVVSLQGYDAVMAGFANSFGDKHLRSIPFLELSRPDWAGVIIGKRGIHWMVVDAEAGTPETALMGAELTSCDGRTPESWGAEVLGGFRADWSVDAQKVQTAPWLLLSEGNPFIARPSHCVFAKDGKAQDHALTWRPIVRAQLDTRLPKASTFGAAGYGVRRVGAGYWIAVQRLMEGAEPVVAAVRAQATEIRAARFVVLDLRGNGGGSSIYGAQIAREVFGPDREKALEDDHPSQCGGDVFRATSGNIATFQSRLDQGLVGHDPEVVDYLKTSIADMKRAQAAGQPFAGRVRCPTAAKAALPPSLFKGKVYILTDGVCFSSCLAVVETWLKLGAIQIGQPTDANTHYTVVHDDLMPSGLSTFSSMLALAPSLPSRLGPFVPTIVYAGDIADTPALEKWVLSLSAR